MIGFILNKKAKKIKGVNATLYLRVWKFKTTIVFGRGNPAQPDSIEFDTFKQLLRGKPTVSSGTGNGILAFKEMMGA